jgi:glycogen debranching enzyme
MSFPINGARPIAEEVEEILKGAGASLEKQHFDPLIEEATQVCRRIVNKNISKTGLAASVDNYPQVWARDTVVTFLGATVSKDAGALEAFRLSLETLESGQDKFGQIPNFIELATKSVSFGSCDSTMWYVVGCCLYAERSGEPEWLEKRIASIRQALNWCEMRDFTKADLVCSMEADDWADLMCHHGHVLFANALWVWALRLASKHFATSHPEEARHWGVCSTRTVTALRTMFWVAPLGSFEDATHHQVRAQMSIRLRQLPYFVSWISLFEFGERFDSAANLLAILAGVAPPDQAASILDYITQEGVDRPYPLRVIHPVIHPGERDWREYYMVWGHGMPYHYHNGGIWPWVGGLYVAALVKAGRKQKATEQLRALASALRLGKDGPWECNEWLHGNSGNPMGAKFQAWSAGMFLYARHCVETGDCSGF